MTDYHKEKLRQLDLWVAGLSVHDSIYDECCPDLSCCLVGQSKMRNKKAYRDQYLKEQGITPLTDRK